MSILFDVLAYAPAPLLIAVGALVVLIAIAAIRTFLGLG